VSHRSGRSIPAARRWPAPASGADLGKAVYDKACFACHAQGIAGAPKQGDKAAWEPRIAQGRDTLVAHAIKGFTGAAGMMPARGGNPSLSDEEVAAGVDYMLGAVGAAAAAPATEAPAVEAPTEAATEPSAAAPADTGKGKDIYDAACTVCHSAGVAGAPKLGDKAAWASRIEKGIEALYHSSINGFMGTAGMMPPKGGRPDFADEDIKAAVDYMVSAAK
jgi:cytochrome c5